jgi:carboxyl-terminal processing protease
MIRLILLVLILCMVFTQDLIPDSQETVVSKVVNQLLEQNHYNKVVLDDKFSAIIFDRYLEDLDGNRAYFLKSDIEKFEKYRFLFDDFIKSGNGNAAFEIYNTLRLRFNERTKNIFNTIEQGFDFSVKEVFEYDRDNKPWAKTIAELDDFWRKRIKSDALNLKLASKADKEIKELLIKRFQTIDKQFNQNKSEDVFQIYMNSYTEMIDPHTNYMSPASSDNFNMRMSLSLEGIGAQLRNEDDNTIVAELIKGGPADMSGQIIKDDKIIGVGQGDMGDIVDVVGWRVDDVVQLIRGKKGTIVRLQILTGSTKVGAAPRIVKLVRDKIKLDEQEAKSKIIEITQNNKLFKIGLITLPTFYLDFAALNRGDKDYKSTTSDCKRLIDSLKLKGIDGLIVDLRNNGGGSLKEAIDLTGLFIPQGPVVQVRNSDETIDVERDTDPRVTFGGTLAVMVNRNSASASEIFAGAIQDYDRGIIIGEHTYGKGTVQRMVDLNSYIKLGNTKLGQIKLTTSKFYRVNGSSTQHKGVVPDIQFPSAFESDEYGESGLKSALPWDQIKSSNFSKVGNLEKTRSFLMQKSSERIKKSLEFSFVREDIAEFQKKNAEKSISLNEEIRKKEQEKEKQKTLTRENARRKELGLKPIKSMEEADKKKEAKDIYLDESVAVVLDILSKN